MSLNFKPLIKVPYLSSLEDSFGLKPSKRGKRSGKAERVGKDRGSLSWLLVTLVQKRAALLVTEQVPEQTRDGRAPPAVGWGESASLCILEQLAQRTTTIMRSVGSRNRCPSWWAHSRDGGGGGGGEMSLPPPSVCGDALLTSAPVPWLIILSKYYRYLPSGHSAHWFTFLANPLVSHHSWITELNWHCFISGECFYRMDPEKWKSWAKHTWAHTRMIFYLIFSCSEVHTLNKWTKNLFSVALLKQGARRSHYSELEMIQGFSPFPQLQSAINACHLQTSKSIFLGHDL